MRGSGIWHLKRTLDLDHRVIQGQSEDLGLLYRGKWGFIKSFWAK